MERERDTIRSLMTHNYPQKQGQYLSILSYSWWLDWQRYVKYAFYKERFCYRNFRWQL